MAAEKGFFSAEALLAFFVLTVIVLALFEGQLEKFSPAGIIAQKKMNDLLIVWAMDETPEGEMAEDAEFFLGNGNFSLEVDGVKLREIRGNGFETSTEMRMPYGFGARDVKISVKKDYFSAGLFQRE